MKRLLFLFLTLIILMAACSEDTPSSPKPSPETPDSVGTAPTIAWDEPSARFRIYTDETLTLVPVLTGTDSTTTYVWTMDGQVVSTESYYSFISSAPGEFFVQLAVTNRYGTTQDEAKITVIEKETAELP